VSGDIFCPLHLRGVAESSQDRAREDDRRSYGKIFSKKKNDKSPQKIYNFFF
jgi:hypothetical protein